MIKGTPTEVGTYLGRFNVKGESQAIYKVFYFDETHGLLLTPANSKITHYMSIEDLEAEL